MYRLAAVACGVVLLLGAEWYFMESGGDSDFASDRVPKAADQFDGKRAMAYLKDVCKIGPRQSGTPNMKKQIEMLQKHFEKLGASVEKQNFTAKQHSQKKSVDMTNLI